MSCCAVPPPCSDAHVRCAHDGFFIVLICIWCRLSPRCLLSLVDTAVPPTRSAGQEPHPPTGGQRPPAAAPCNDCYEYNSAIDPCVSVHSARHMAHGPLLPQGRCTWTRLTRQGCMRKQRRPGHGVAQRLSGVPHAQATDAARLRQLTLACTMPAHDGTAARFQISQRQGQSTCSPPMEMYILHV